MTAPRAREQADPPSPPDRPPPRRGGHPFPSTASAAGGGGLVGFARGLAAAAFLLAAAAVLPVAPVAAQDVAPAAPTGFAVAPGSIKAKLSWDDPPAGVIRHEVRFRAGAAAFPNWQRIPDSDSGGDNASGYILSGLTAETDYDFELRAVNGGAGDAATAAAMTLPPFTARFNTENKYHTGGPFTIEVEFTAAVEKEVLRRGVFFGNSSSQDVAQQDERPELWHFVPHPRSRTRAVTINIPRATSCGTGKICSTLGEPLTNALVRSVPYRPTVSLKLKPAEISEDGGASMITASLDQTWSEDVTVVVSASPVSPATSSDFALGSNTTLTIRAGARTSTGDVTITAVNNDVAAADKQVEVSGMVTAPDYVPAPAERTLTILDDDAGLAAPTGFAVSAGSTKAKLSWDEPSDGAVITAHEVRYRADAEEFPATWETIPNSAPGQANEKGYTVTGLSPGTAYDFELRAATSSVESSAASASATTQAAFTARFETIPATHDGTSFSVRIGFSADIASLSAVEEGVQLTGARNTGVDRVDGRSDLFDYAVIPSGEAGVTITLPVSSGCSSNRGICNTFDEPLAAELAQTIGFFGVPSGRKLVGNVTKALSNGALPVDPSSGFVFAQSFRTGTNETGYKLDEIGIHFSDAGVGDMAVVSLLSATDDGEPGSVLFPLTGRGGLTNGRLTYFSAPPGALLAKETPYYLQVTGFGSSMFNVRILGDADETAEDGNSLAGWSIGDDLREKTVSTSWITTPKVMQLRVNGRVLGAAPSVFLGLEPAAVAENGAAATVTATVSPASATAFTVTVSAAPVDPAMASDFRLSTNTTLSFAANATKSTGIVTVTAVDNDVKAADKQVTVSGSVTGNDSIADPDDVTLLILDDERAAVSLVLTPRAIAENGGTSTVTATVSRASPTAFDVTVSAAPVNPATASDFRLSTNTTLGFAANATQSTGIVTVTAVNNDDQTENRRVTVSGSVSAAGIVAPAARRLTILDAGAPTFTAWFDEIPERHNGVTAFTVRIHFSAGISSFRTLEDGVQLSGGTRGNVTRVNNRSDLWNYPVTQLRNGDVVITLPIPSGCNTTADLCSSANVPLTTRLVGRIAGPASIDPSDEPREPSPPTNFRADALDGAVRLHWRAPIFDGGSPITGHEYRAKRRYIVSQPWRPWTSIPESTPGGQNGESFTVTEDMQNGTTYEFQLRARNSLGTTFATPRTVFAIPEAGQLPFDFSLTPSPPDPAVATHSRAVYTVTFEGQWTTEATSGGVPSGAHFSRLVGGVHNADVVFVEDLSLTTASPGIESMAETGGTATLKTEIVAAGDKHLSVLEGANNSILATASESLTGVTLTTDHPRVTLLTMVAPSPDWFVGVSGLSMLDTLGGWRESRTVELHPFDAGTEEGTEFSLTNDDTVPHERIRSLLGKGKFSAEPIATLTFQRTAVVTVPAAPTDLTATAGTGQVELAWTMGGDGGNAIAKHQYRYRTGPTYLLNWTDIPDSAAGEDNAASFTVVNLTIGLAHTFQVRAVNELGEGPAATAGALALNLDTIAGDDTVNIAEKAAGFAISGDTGSEAGATVSVTIGTESPLTATSGSGGAWSVDVPANAAYITGTSVAVTVSAAKTGFTAPSDVTRTLAVDLTAPSATYTAPSSLQVGVAVSAMTPSTTATDIASYSATGLPSGLGIDTGTGVISGTPDTADANTASAAVTVKDTAGNTVDVSITFPAVAKEAQTLTGFAYSSASVTFGGTAPTVTAPGGVQTTLSYSATPATVCTVDASTGALTLVGVGACEITATAAGTADYNEATAAFTVTVQAAEVLALNLDTIAGDDTVNIAEKAAGFVISGDTGSEGGVTVSVTIGTESPLTATSGSGGAWSVDVPADAAYITGTSVTVTVSASKTGYTPPSDVTRALAVDLTAPSATYTPPSSLQVGVAIGAMTPSTTATDIASYSATGLPSGLGIDTGTGVISGTPDTADASTASATVTVKDTAGNAADASITFPAVAKGDQTLTGFAYSPATVTYGDTAPAVTAPGGVQTTLSYSATPATVCTVDASTGALTLVGVGACEITATAASTADYNEATAAFTVTVQAAEVLALNVDAIAGDDTVNIAEKAAGFTISGDTGSEGGVSVTVTVGTTDLTATSAAADPATWSVSVPPGASYITGMSVAVTVSASKTGYTPPSDVTRALAVDLTAPAASYTAPGTLQVGMAIGAITPSTTDTDIAEYSATGLPSGLGIDTGTGVISGTPDTADASTASATVTVTDTAGNAADASITFPAVAKGDQTLTGFAYSPATVTYGDTAPAVTAPGGVQTTLSYSATPPGVCTVDASTGALTLVGVGACEITATAASTADYNEATAAFTVTVQAAGALALSLDTIAGDDRVNIAEKAAGFAISGDTGSEAGVTVSVTIGTESPLTATSGSGGAWSVDVPANAAYLTGTSVTVTVSASKTGFTSPSDVTRALAVDLTAPAASYTAPGTLQVGVAIGAMTPSTTATDIASYSATGLPPGLGIDTGTGVISGTPDTADANTASAAVTVTDTVGNTVDVPITFPAVAKGDQTLTGFAYSSASVTFGDTAPAVTAPGGVQTTLSYSATPPGVCTVDASTGALTLVGVGACEITATAASTADYDEATASFSVTVQAAGALALSLDTIAGDDRVNIAEKAAGFAISGDTGSEAGVTVSVTIGTESPLTATSGSGGAWSVDVPANAAYLTGTSVTVTVSASKTGFTSPSDVTRALAVDLTAPAASYTAPGTLQVGVAIGAMTPSTTATDIASYSATGLPPGLGIDTGTGVISGTPDTADANTASAAVTVTDTVGNTVDVPITFPAVAKGDQTLTGFAYSSASVTFGDTAPAVTAPGGVQTTLSYSATPPGVCTVDASTGALTLVGVGACEITATAAGTADYDEATASFSVTVQAAGALALSLDTIAGDDRVNIAEKAAGFTISGDTGSESGVTVSVTIGTESPLTATSGSGGAWSVDVPANAAYLTGTSVTVTVSASKTGFTSPSDVTRALAVDLTAPAASYTAPGTLQVGVAIGAMTPSTTATDIAEYSATGLPSGLGIDTGTGVISGTPDTADANTASAAVTVKDTAGNTADVSITFPAVAKGAQTLTGFAYSSASVTFGGTAPAVTAPSGVQTTLTYAATPATVCTVDSSTGALTLVEVGACNITATAAGTADYNEATASFSVTVQAADALALNLDTIAGDDTVNIAEKAAGVTISGDTGTESGVSVTVTVGSTPLTATSAAGGAWSADVPANAAYLTGASVTVTVSASKTGFTSPSDVMRTLAVDLTAPAASYTAPSSLQVGVAIGAMTPSTTATDIASYSATGLPSGLDIDTGAGVISGTPDTADANTASAAVTVKDTAGNTADVSITFPAVAKGAQTLTGFAYSSASVTFGGTAPAVTAPSGVQTTLTYAATPATVCTVDSSTGALTLVEVGACNITATAAGTADYNEATASFSVTVQAAGALALNLDTIAGDDTVNIAEKAAGVTISGDTGTESGVSVTVTVGSTPLTATSAAGGAWSADVPANAAYLTGASVTVTVSASKTGFTSPSDVMRTLAVDLTAPAASYTAPSSLQVGVAIGAMTPSTTATDIAEYSATGLPSGLDIDTGAGVISGTPDTADANTASAAVTVKDTAGNTADVSITFPAVAKGAQTLTGFAYSSASVTFGGTAPAVTAPSGVQTTLTYAATPATVCTVDSSTGALTLVEVGACNITATAAGTADYNEATASFSVTVQAAGALALNLDTIAGDDTVNIAEKAAGVTISGDTGTESGVSVTVTVGSTPLTATSAAGGAWSVDVPANAAYITGASVAVTVSASKTGLTSPSDVMRTLAVDLTAPAASYTAPSSLKVGVAIGAMTPSTTATDIASYSATGLPSGLDIDTGAGVISGTPDTADANTASAAVTVKDTAGNTADVSITFPAVAKGAQTLTGFAYGSASVAFGGTAPAVTAPGGVQTTLSYSATPATVCTVDASTGALTLVGVGACEITATAAGTANYNEATASFAVTVQAAGALALNLDAIATDNTVNIVEKVAGFTISGATGSEAGVTVSVTIGTESPLTATSGSGGAWSVDVAANAAYITGTSVAVTVAASKTGFTSPSDVTRALAVDLTAPAASYTAPSSLQVGVAIGAMTPSTTATDIAEYSATGLPPGLGIDTGTGVISGTPDTADASTASATVTVKDTAGNAADASITFPAVAKGDQTLTGFAYSPATVTYGDTAPAVTAPGGVQTTLSYSATPVTVCTVDASTGALTLVGAGACEITATAAGAANYNEATASFSVTVQAAGVLALSLDAIATDNTVNIAEKAAGFAISGDTGSEAGVTVTVGGTELTATSAAGGAWSVDVPANAAYITGASVAVTVSASKTGLTSPSDVMRTLAVDLTAPAASYTAPSTLQVGVAIGAMTPSTTATDIAEYSATGLPSGLGIDTGTGVISGTPDTADASTASATVTVKDTAGNAADASITFPAVAKGDQTLTGFAYSPATVTYGDTAPAVTAPGGVQTTLSYSATPVTVCTVDASTGALTLVGAGACEITATAAGAANYNEATASFSVTVQAAGVLALSLDAIAADDTVNIAEKAAGFAISGDTGSEAGVTVTVGGTELTATSAAGGAWSVDVPANAAYITGASVAVTVSASKTGLTSPSDVMRTLAVDLTAPAASYTAPSTLQVGVAIGAMTPSTTATDIAEYSATGLPSGLGIDTGTGVISGTPDTADANTADATVTVTDRAGNPATVSITFPAVANDDTEAPDKPAKPTVSATSATSLTATWTEPGLNGGPAITGYNVEYRVSTATTWDDWTHTDTATTTTITGLTADTEYQVQVRALNGETPSDWSDPSDAVRTDTETMAEEAEDRLREINCAMDRLDDESDARCNGITDSVTGSYVKLVALQFQVIGQLPPGEYDYYDLAGWQTLYKMGDGRVIITRGGGAWTEDLTPARAPRDLEAKATGEGIVLSWQAPKAASDEVTDYRVLRRRPEEGEPVLRVVVADIGGTARAWTDTGVEEGVRYTYRVMAVRGRELSGVSNARSLRGVAMADSGPEAPAPLTASFEGLPEAHDGEDAFHFRVAFSEDIGIGFRSMRDDSFTVDGGEVTGARRVDGRHDLWEITVEPGSDEAMTVALPGGRECAVSGAICTRGENRRQLANTPAATVAGPVDAPAVLTASFVQAPAEHDGKTAFKLLVAFSEGISIGFRTFRDQSLSVSGGSVKKAKRVDRRRDLWDVTVKPGSLGDVTVTLEGGRACGTAGAVCTGDGRALSATISTTVLGPAALSVADARVREAEDALLVFEVTLDRARHAAVTVDYVTSDVTARAGEDYTSASGTLTFATGERSKTVEVTVLDDAHDEGEETLTLALSNPSGAYLADATATGTIENSDHMPKAWMVRFGRTVGSQLVDALTQRLDGAGGSHVTVAGINLIGAPGLEPQAEDDPFGLPEWAKHAEREADARTITAEDIRLRSAFHLSSGGDGTHGGGPAFTAWGRVVTGGFRAEEDGGTMDGDVTNGLVGFDAEWERALAGIMLSQSSGDGSYRLDPAKGDDAGTVESSLTGVYPYARVDLNRQVSAWALAGIGSGELTLHQQGGKPMPTDISMRMGAVGVKGQVLDGTGASGLAMNVKSDAMWVGTKSSDTSDLASTEGDVTRVRLILQGERRFEVGNGATFTPSAKVGLRHDGGDAETGTGVEVGAGLRYTAGAVTVAAQARTLLVHEASGYEDWGASGAIRVTPDASGRGLTLSIAPVWGRTGSAAERLWSARDARALGGDSEFEAGSRLVIDAGYGFGLAHRRGVLTPYAGLTLGDAGNRTVRTGTRWQVSPDATFGLEATRQASDAGEAANEVRLRAALRF